MVIKNNKIAHMHGVAEFMYRNASLFDLDKEQMYVIGLLHDIGCVNGKDRHEDYGFNLLKGLDLPENKVRCISWHGNTPETYKNMFDCSGDEIPKDLVLLWMADMSVDSEGNEVGFEKRLEDVERRYGSASQAFVTCNSVVCWLRKQGYGERIIVSQ